MPWQCMQCSRNRPRAPLDRVAIHRPGGQRDFFQVQPGLRQDERIVGRAEHGGENVGDLLLLLRGRSCSSSPRSCRDGSGRPTGRSRCRQRQPSNATTIIAACRPRPNINSLSTQRPEDTKAQSKNGWSVSQLSLNSYCFASSRISVFALIIGASGRGGDRHGPSSPSLRRCASSPGSGLCRSHFKSGRFDGNRPALSCQHLKLQIAGRQVLDLEIAVRRP